MKKIYQLLIIVNLMIFSLKSVAYDYKTFKKSGVETATFVNLNMFGSNIYVVNDENGITFVLPSDVYITQDLAIDPKMCLFLQRLYDYLISTYGVFELTITGHSDKIGYPADKEYRSYMHAKVIADFFVSIGMSPLVIKELAGKGDQFILFKPADNPVHRFLNRRVEIKVLRRQN